MKRRIFRKIWLIFIGLVLILSGLVFLVAVDDAFVTVAFAGGFLIAINGIHQIVSSVLRKKRARMINGVINTAAGLFICLFPSLTLGIVSVLLSLYMFLNAAVKTIDFIASARNGTADLFADFVSALFFVIFGIITLVSSFNNQEMMRVIIGIYCIMYGATEMKDFVREIMPNKAKNRIRRSIRVSVPAFISAFAPLGVLNNYRERLDSREIDIEKLLEEEKAFDDNGKRPNIHVLIHVSDDGVGKLGHCDLCLDGVVLSYGNYDAASERLFGAVGDGVLFCAEFKTYIDYSVRCDKKMIFDYGLLLTDKQMRKVRDEIGRLRATSYRWRPPFEKALAEGKTAKLSDFSDYCSRLWDGTKAHFYKFRSGRFKSYCVMSTNCVLLTDSILSKAGTDIINTVGIISPGAYYDYMQKEYALENGLVVSREIYSKYQQIK